MSDINFNAVELALAALEQGLDEYAQYPQLLTLRDGVIQRFEFTMDISKQLLVRVLKEVFLIEEASAKRDTFREAAQLGLIADAGSWMAHLTARNETSHTYDSAKAAQVFAHVPSLLPDVRDMLKRLHRHVA
jgi:nucleotidyltransferase substrate binding protein (TIGR01987 family)